MSQAPSIAVIGPGAIGTTIAALVYAEGHPVLVCGRTPRAALEVRPDDGAPIVVPEPVCTDPAEVAGPVDIVLLAVKDTQTEAAAGWLARLCDERTVVCAMQNGVEQRERVGRWCPESTVLPCVVWFSAETQEQGWVRLRTPVRLVLPDEPAAGRLEALRGPRLSLVTQKMTSLTVALQPNKKGLVIALVYSDPDATARGELQAKRVVEDLARDEKRFGWLKDARVKYEGNIVFVTRFACSTMHPELRCTVSLKRSHGSIPVKRKRV